MKIQLVSLGLLLSVSAKECSKKKSSIPLCIQDKIEAIRKEPRWNPPAQVVEYMYNEKTVYYFTSDCCDNFNAVVDGNCNYICAPSGGITGRGDGLCADFNRNAKKIRVVWKDERGDK